MAGGRGYMQPWEPIRLWEHGRFTEKYVSRRGALSRCGRVVLHNLHGVSWFAYDERGNVIGRGQVDSIQDGQRLADEACERIGKPRRPAA